MSTIKLKGSSSGEAEVTVAAAAGTPTFTLPTTVGSANQLVKNSGTAGTLQYSSLVEDSSGRVGIGTTATDKNSRSFLNIHQASSDANYMYFTNSTTGEAGSDGFTIGLDSDEKAMLWNRENTDIRFATNATERLTIKNDGHVSIVSGNLEFANGAGIDFSNVPDGSRSIGTDGNKFDDYEEGSWTMNPHDGTCTTSYGKYRLIGQQVTLWGRASGFSDTSTNDMIKIKGLPYAASSSWAGAAGAAMIMQVDQVVPWVAFAEDDHIKFYGSATGSFEQLRHNELNSGHEIYFCATYTIG